MLACESVVPFDAYAPAEDPGDPCPVCSDLTVEDGVCSLCGAELCEVCGKVEVTGASACCDRCAPLYSVSLLGGYDYNTHSLRRAWEAQRYLDESAPYGATLLNRSRTDFDTDGITDREQRLLESWDCWTDTDIGRRCAPVHLCLQRGL